MKLFIDTSDSEKIVIGLDGQRFETQSKKEKAQRLLPFIIETLENSGKLIDDITEIEVNTGPGSFTGLRVGVSVANAIGYAKNIPVNGKLASRGEFVEIKYS